MLDTVLPLQRVSGTAAFGSVRTVVWDDGWGDPASYPIRGCTAAGSEPLPVK